MTPTAFRQLNLHTNDNNTGRIKMIRSQTTFSTPWDSALLPLSYILSPISFRWWWRDDSRWNRLRRLDLWSRLRRWLNNHRRWLPVVHVAERVIEARDVSHYRLLIRIASNVWTCISKILVRIERLMNDI